MQSSHAEPLLLGALMLAALVPLVVWMASSGRLGRNAMLGIRTATFMRTKAAWRRGHALALPYALISSVASLAGIVATLWCLPPGSWIEHAAAWVCFLLPVVGVLWGTLKAHERLRDER